MYNDYCLSFAFQAISMTRPDSAGLGDPWGHFISLRIRHQPGLYQLAHDRPVRRLPEIGTDTKDQGLPCI